jgi:O-antigen ligase
MKDRYNLILALAFLALVALLGGASRADAMTQLPLRLASIGFIVLALWQPNLVRMGRYKALFAFLGLTALLPALQLIPLPFGMWEAIPGREFYADISRQVGLPEVSRPLSLVPGMTRNALFSLVVPIAALIVISQVAADRLPRFAIAILLIALVSLVLGHAQAAGGVRSELRFYRITNTDSMVGIFANRNHHAVLLALAIPILGVLAASYRENPTWRRIGVPVCLLGALAVGGTLLFAGSRAGLLTGAVGALAGALLYASASGARPAGRGQRRPKRFAWMERLSSPWLVPAGAAAAIAVAAIGFASTPAMQRLIRTNAAEEDRLQLLPSMLELAQAMLPFGGGFGGFNQLFRRFEEVEQLKTVYLNHAHMEPVQILIEGGIPAALLLVAFLIWWAWRTWTAWRQPASARIEANLARLGSITTLLVLLGSLGDYPLRTPLHMVIFVIGCVWLQRGANAPAR